LNQNARTVRVSEAIAPDLMLRVVAEAFFDEIERSEDKTLILDFTAIRSVSRSFAHQYAIRKRASKKHLVEANMSPEIARMFELVNRNQQASRMILPRVSKAEVITV